MPKLRQVEEQLSQLEGYKRDYLEALQRQGGEGVAHFHLQNQFRFIHNLQTLREQQAQQREFRFKEIEGLQSELRQLHQKSETLARALERLEREERYEDKVQDQKRRTTPARSGLITRENRHISC